MKITLLLLVVLGFVSCSGFTGLNTRGYTEPLDFKSVKEISGEEVIIQARLISFFPYSEIEDLELADYLNKYNKFKNRVLTIFKIKSEMDFNDTLISLIPFVASRTYIVEATVKDKSKQ